jgi:hypothetical protein
MRHRLILVAAAAAAVTGASSARAQGGPPLMTDDPGTPDPGTWEINLALTGDLTRDTRSYEAPVVDLNYGAGGHVQLTFSLPWAFTHDAGASTRGDLGDVEAGAKWRFVDQGHTLPVDVSTFPKLVFHPSLAGPQQEGTELLVPFQVARSLGPLAVNLDGGRVFQRHSPVQWFYGAAVQYARTDAMQWLAEVHVETGSDEGTQRYLNGGFRRDLDRHRILLFSIGRNLLTRGAPGETVAYVGVQIHG